MDYRDVTTNKSAFNYLFELTISRPKGVRAMAASTQLRVFLILFLLKELYLLIAFTRNAPQGERVEIMQSPVCVGGAGEEGSKFLMDGGGQPVALERLHEPQADDALILAGHNPQRIGIGTGADAHGLHLLRYDIAKVEMACVGYAVGIVG